jgi:Bacterial PH domain
MKSRGDSKGRLPINGDSTAVTRHGLRYPDERLVFEEGPELMSFAAKVDLWFLALFYGFGVFMLVGSPLIRKKRRGAAASGLLFVLGLLFIAIGWRATAVRYLITEDGYLDAAGWPLNGRIAHVSEIRSIASSHDPRASHAASLDRLRIDYGERGVIFVAVEDEAGFLEALSMKDANLTPSPSGLIRRPSANRVDTDASHPKSSLPIAR